MLEDDLKQCSKCGEWQEKRAFNKVGRVCHKCKYKRFRERFESDSDFRERIKGQKSRRYSSPEYKARNHTRYLEYYWSDPEAHRARDREQTRERWSKCIEMAGGVCQKCRQSKEIPVMSFHHVDPAQKARKSTEAVRRLDLVELDKCALLCMECHVLFEADYWRGYWQKRDGLGWELVKWWDTFRHLGERYDR